MSEETPKNPTVLSTTHRFAFKQCKVCKIQFELTVPVCYCGGSEFEFADAPTINDRLANIEDLLRELIDAVKELH